MEFTEILAQAGWAGILALAVAYVFREYAEAQKRRIDVLEELAKTCEEDRRKLHEVLQEVREELRELRRG